MIPAGALAGRGPPRLPGEGSRPQLPPPHAGRRGWAPCLPQRAMKTEKKTVAGLSKRWLARAVAHAELIFQ